MPFYMWPLSHSMYTRGVLDQIMQEGRVRGATFRQRVLSEQDVGLRPAETKYVKSAVSAFFVVILFPWKPQGKGPPGAHACGHFTPPDTWGSVARDPHHSPREG